MYLKPLQACPVPVLLAALLAGGLPGSARSEPRRLVFEAEALAATAEIDGSGQLIAFAEPDDGRLELSEGRAVSFIPGGKGTALELALPGGVPDAVYRLRVFGVVGPSCGAFNVFAATRRVGWLNTFSATTQHMTNHPPVRHGMRTGRFLYPGDPEGARIRFVYESTQGRGANLVLDTLRLEPDPVRFTPVATSPFEVAPPADERHGENLIRNGDFEAFSPEDKFTRKYEKVGHWALNCAAPPAPCIVRNAAAAHGGKQALHLKPGPLDDNTVVYQFPVPCRSGERYRFSAWARGEGQFYVYINQDRQADPETALRLANHFDAGAEWSRYTFVMAPSHDANVSSVQVHLYAATASDIFMDDVELRRILEVR